MNKVILTGRLTKNIELKYTQNNTAIANYSIAVQRNFKNQDGVYEADFINCVSYGKTAELISNYTKKGDKLLVEGRIQTRSYENDKGDKVRVIEIITDRTEFLQSMTNSTKKEEKPEEQAKSSLDDEVFADFGSSIEISDEDIAF